MNVIRVLYDSFPREIGIPNRITVYSYNHMIDYIKKYNGVSDVFVSVYQLPENRYVYIDKIFFDMDFFSLPHAYKFSRFLKEKFGNCITIFSGRKGFHFYVLLKRKRYLIYEAKRLLSEISYSLIKESGMYMRKGIEKYPLVDTKVIGDIRRLARCPSTLRPPQNTLYCTVLPDDFSNFDIFTLLNYCSKPHDISEIPKRKYFLDEIEYEKGVESEFSKRKCISSLPNIQIDTSTDILIDDVTIEKIVRPCIMRVMKKGIPEELRGIVTFHDVCTALAVDLFYLGLNKEEVVYVFKRLLGKRFNEKYTRYQIDYMLKDGLLHRYSCRWFKQRGLCIVSRNPNELCNWWVLL